MSLSFVKSAVLSSSDGISHNEEKTIDNAETTSLRSRSTAAKPLFEQLRANKEAEQEAADEFQRSLRGTRMLDDEDCAHLDAVERVREERDREVKSGIEREVALFRARREDRAMVQSVLEEEEGEESGTKKDGSGEAAAPKKEAKKTIVPKFIVKKKKRRQDGESNNEDEKPVKSAKRDDFLACDVESKQNVEDPEVNEANPKSVGGLLGLGDYGSDSD
ncbi:hypothetical protein ACHAXN_008786 [Cyclotella atomus]